MRLTTEELRKLEPYRQNLPLEEYKAVTAWLSTFWPFQRPWMLDYSRNAFCNKARQIGISHSTSGICVLWGALHGETTTVISVGEREAKEVLDKCKKHRDVLVRLGSKMARKRKQDSAEEIHFASGGRIIALPSTGGRSFTGNVYLDEFAYYRDPGAVWDAAMAVTMLGFKTRISSTPNGVGNDFHSLVTDEIVRKGWSPHEIPLKVALDFGYPVDIENCWTLAKGDPRIYDQLFNCSFLDGEFQYIPTVLINEASVDTLPPILVDGAVDRHHGDYYAGLDIGKTVDRTVLTVGRSTPAGLVLVYAEERSRTDADGLDAMVARAFKTFRIKRLTVDSTGLGNFPAEQMQKKHGFWNVEPFNFSATSKEELATQLYTAFQRRQVLIPKRDESFGAVPEGCPPIPTDFAKNLRNDLCSIRREITTSGNVRYDAPHTDKGHADRAWSLALMVHAAGQAMPRGNLPPELAAVL